jgi:hypothetical protein
MHGFQWFRFVRGECDVQDRERDVGNRPRRSNSPFSTDSEHSDDEYDSRSGTASSSRSLYDSQLGAAAGGSGWSHGSVFEPHPDSHRGGGGGSGGYDHYPPRGMSRPHKPHLTPPNVHARVLCSILLLFWRAHSHECVLIHHMRN